MTRCTAEAAPGVLHVVRTETLLWRLEAFANVRADYNNHRFTRKQVAKLREIAARKRAKHGEVTQLAELWGRNLRVLYTYLGWIRRGCEPRYWRQI
jgi:hypothetical protein